MILKTIKHAITAERNSTTSERIFHKLAVKNVNVNVVKTIYCQRNSIFLAKKNYSIHYLTSQNRGLSGLKSIWPVMMTGDLLSVILSPAQGFLYTTSSFLRGSTAPLAIRYVLMPCCRKQRRRGSHNRLMYGRTALDLISAVGSFIRCLVLGFCEVRYKRIGEFLRDKTEDKCLSSSEIFMV